LTNAAGGFAGEAASSSLQHSECQTKARGSPQCTSASEPDRRCARRRASGLHHDSRGYFKQDFADCAWQCLQNAEMQDNAGAAATYAA
jgi:hypothetical protein